MDQFIPDSVHTVKLLSDTLKVVLMQPQQSISYLNWISPAIALLAVVFGPIITLFLGKRQTELQLNIANRQISNQVEIAQNQIRATVLSSNRQEWIHILREQLSELTGIAVIMQFHLTGEGTYRLTPDQFLEKLGRIYFLSSKVKLLLNPEKELQKDIINKVEGLTNKLTSDKSSELQSAIDDLNIAGQKLFRDTWLRVKELR